MTPRKFGALGAALLRFSGLFLLLSFASGCGSKGAVTLLARADDPHASVVTVALGSQLSGDFDLWLELGEYAPEATEVTLGTFALKNAGGVVKDGLGLVAAETFPLSVGVGKSKVVPMTLDSGEFIDSQMTQAICDGEVWYTGTINDTVSDGKSTVVSSNPFSASCP